MAKMTIEIPDNEYKGIKIRAIELGMTIKDYMLSIIHASMEDNGTNPNGMDETEYLLSSETNKKYLLETIDKINRGDKTGCVTFNSTAEMVKYFENLPDEECEG